MTVLHLPNTHPYQFHLMGALRTEGIDVDARPRGWGIYLPDQINDILERHPDLVHLHWPEALCRQAVHGYPRRLLRRFRLLARGEPDDWNRWLDETASALDRLRQAGIRLVWTQHNLAPHHPAGRPGVYDRLYRDFAGRADAAIHHSRWGEGLARSRLPFPPGCRHARIHFGVIPDEAPGGLEQITARRQLGIPAETLLLLTVGSVGPRKHLDLLINGIVAAREIPCALTVVGACPPETTRHLAGIGQGRVRFAGPLPQAELSLHARAADFLLFAPDPAQLTSGAPHLSEAFRLPQLTTDHPYVREVLGSAALYFPPDPEGLRLALANAQRLLRKNRDEYEALRNRLDALRAGHGWDAAARQTARLYSTLLEPAP